MAKTPLMGLLLVLPVIVSAEVMQDESCDEVLALLRTPGTYRQALSVAVDRGMSLGESTVFAMNCGGAQDRTLIAAAGVESAGGMAEAQAVVAAVVTAAGATSPEAAAAREALRVYATTAAQPPVYQSDYIPHGGGGVSPST